MPDLLIEFFSEEIPARMQRRASEDLKKLMTDGLVEAGLTYASAGAFVTPRRLVLLVEGLTAASPTTSEERRGPRIDAPEKALDGFLRGAGVTRDQLESREDKKGTFYYARITTDGRPAKAIIADLVPQVIRDFPWPKSMRWGRGTLRWVRPLQSILCVLSDESGSDVVPFDVDGIRSGDTTEGHRFMAPGRFSVAHFEDYSAKLKRAFVVLSAADRADAIWHDATTMAFAAGLEVVEDAALLAEVAGLVEWPVVLMGEIGEAFLGLPPEVLQTSMREHQKFFSVRNPASGRIERFITVANRETADEGETILSGNAKVLSARLSDAHFFWENDLRIAKAGMDAWIEGLKAVTFHAKLGSQADRIARIAALAREIAPMVGADPDLAEEAARIAKADLRSEMVGEFPELQGVMGRYYALAAGRAPAVADACRDHWKPMGAGDEVPTEPVSVAVALADKIDTLTGFWAIDEKPTGSKDPFALRRAALGVIRTVLDAPVRIHLSEFLVEGLSRGTIAKGWNEAQASANALIGWSGFDEYLKRFDLETMRYELREVALDLLAFFHDRLKVHLRDEGIRHDVIDAALAKPPTDDLTLVVARARSVQAFLDTPDGANLIQGYKRSANILAQAEEKDGVEYRYGADIKFAEMDAERRLFAALDAAREAIGPAVAEERFADAMGEMARLRAPIDAFFEAVQVNAENPIVRRNRLNLLFQIAETCNGVADLGRIEG